MRDIEDFMSQLSSLPGNQRVALERILDRIYRLVLDADLTPETRDKRLSEIDRYLTNKSQRNKSEVTIDESEFLRFVRNSIQHGPNVSADTIDKAMPIFWRVLAKSGPEWNREHIEHLLSYALDKPPLLMIQSDDSNGATIIRHYEKVFKRLATEDKRKIFRDLFLSIYLMPEFQQALGTNKRSGSRARSYER